VRKTPAYLFLSAAIAAFASCPKPDDSAATSPDDATAQAGAGADGSAAEEEKFEYRADRFADAAVLRYRIPGFEGLSLQQKQLLYYLSQAALSGRDIIYDQKNKHNLAVRKTNEAIIKSYGGDRKAPEFEQFTVFAKQVWFANGIHHDYSSKKFTPQFTKEQFTALVKGSDAKLLPLAEGETVDQLIDKLTPVLFDPKVLAKRVNRASGADLVKDSANNFYEGVTQKQVEKFYKKKIDKKDKEPVSWGLNSKLLKKGKKLEEQLWKADGMYGPAIQKIVFWLEKAITVAENDKQRDTLEKLVKYYQSGELKDFDAYNIAWVKDTDSRIDVVNGFIEVYDDAMGYRGTYESVVSFRDQEATKRIAAVSEQAQWFEDNSPLMDKHKKKSVVGISAKVITVVMEAGDASPTTPIGINLPNSNWIRATHGSKSVNLGNIVHAYDKARSGDGRLEEFASSPEEVERTKKYGALAHTLEVDMHEVIGHASGQLEAGVGTPKETLKSYSSALEEGRADLVALYYVMDPKLVEMGLMPSLEVGKAAYDGYIRNGLLVQLSRIEKGENIEESHMRNRQMVAAWAYEKGKKDNVIERVEKDGKTYFVVRDYDKLRQLFGELLKEVQRIKSQGDYKAGKKLIETYGVKVDQELHAQVLERWEVLGVAPYSGFIQPKLVPVMDGETITDVKVEYPDDFVQQMLEYGDNYAFLPTYN
jgi:dipeptidyl-peptidase-3